MKKDLRLNQELLFLQDRRQFQLKDLMTEFNISKRTALRDVEALEYLGVALYAEAGRAGGYKLLPQNLLTRIYFSTDEITAILFALKYLKQLSVTPFDHSYANMMSKLTDSLSEKQQQKVIQATSVINYYNSYQINQPTYLSQLLAAILNEAQVTVTYCQFDTVTITLQFLDLFYRDGVWFSHGYDSQQNNWSIYRCDYISKLEKTSALGLHRQKLEKLFNDYWNDYAQIPCRCQLTQFGKELFLKKHYEDMILTESQGHNYLDGKYNLQDSDLPR